MKEKQSCYVTRWVFSLCQSEIFWDSKGNEGAVFLKPCLNEVIADVSLYFQTLSALKILQLGVRVTLKICNWKVTDAYFIRTIPAVVPQVLRHFSRLCQANAGIVP
jgi:hypothetical protein